MSAIAATMLVVNAMSMSVGAANSRQNYSTRHVNNAPGSESYSGYCSMTYSTFGQRVYVTSATSSTGAGGKVNVSYVAGQSQPASGDPIYNIGNRAYVPVPVGEVTSVEYTLTAYTSAYANAYTASGYVITRTSSYS